MYKIKLKKLEEIVRKDKNVLKVYFRYIREELEKEEFCFKILEEKQQILKKCEEKLVDINRREQNCEEEENRENGKINILEIRKIFSERQLKWFKRNIDDTNQAKFSQSIAYYEKNIDKLSEKQNICCKNIDQIRGKRSDLKHKKRNALDEIESARRNRDTAQNNYQEWEETVDLKTERFYKGIMNDVTEQYDPCSEIVIPFLAEDKKLPLVSAKEEAEQILIDEKILLEKDKQRQLLK